MALQTLVKLNAYVGLDRDQKGWVREDIDKLFDWHLPQRRN